MDIDEVMRDGRPDSAGWARSDAGQQVLDGVIATAPAAVTSAADASGRTVVGRAVASRPVLRWSFLGTGLVGAAAAAVLAVSVIAAPQGPGAGTPPQAGGQPGAAEGAIGGAAPVTASDILLAAATRAEQAPAETGKYWHVKTIDVVGPVRVGTDRDPYWLLRRSVNESWDASDQREASWTGHRDLGVRPRGEADEQAWRAAGSPAQWTLDVDGRLVLSTEPDEGTLTKNGEPPRYLEDIGQLTLEQVRQLPDEQDALRDWVAGRIQTEMGHAPGSTEGNRLLFGFVSRMLLDTPAPPKVRAAAFRILAGTPGIRSLGTVSDDNGRSGQGVEFTDGTTTIQMIIDGSTHLLLAAKTISEPEGRVAKELSTLVLTAEWSDAAPHLPTLP